MTLLLHRFHGRGGTTTSPMGIRAYPDIRDIRYPIPIRRGGLEGFYSPSRRKRAGSERVDGRSAPSTLSCPSLRVREGCGWDFPWARYYDLAHGNPDIRYPISDIRYRYVGVVWRGFTPPSRRSERVRKGPMDALPIDPFLAQVCECGRAAVDFMGEVLRPRPWESGISDIRYPGYPIPIRRGVVWRVLLLHLGGKSGQERVDGRSAPSTLSCPSLRVRRVAVDFHGRGTTTSPMGIRYPISDIRYPIPIRRGGLEGFTLHLGGERARKGSMDACSIDPSAQVCECGRVAA